MKKRQLLSKYNLSLGLLLFIFLPGLFGLIYSLIDHTLPKQLQPDYQLLGVTTASTSEKFSFDSVTNHSYQKYIETYLTEHLPFRSLLIRLNNQFYYSLFKKSYNNDNKLIIGKSRQLLTTEYIYSYCGMLADQPHHTTDITAWADKIKTLHDYFTKRGQVFIYLITPSKVGYMPEKIPPRFQCQQRGTPLYLQEMVKELDKRKIPYIDGQALMELGRQQYHTSMFSRGGIHWNGLGATLAANKIIDKIDQNSLLNISSLQFKYRFSHPILSDRDLLDLLNLMHPNLSYRAPKMDYLNLAKQNQLSVVFIGGSFCERLIDIFWQTHTFNKIAFYSYFKMFKLDFESDKPPTKSAVDLTSPTLLDPIKLANVVILEENAETTVSKHGDLFYQKMQEYKQI